MMTLVLLAMLAQDAAPTNQAADAAIRKLSEECLKPSVDVKIAAIREAVRTRHERVARSVGAMLLAESDAVRIAAASALVEIDHPASADILSEALRPNLRRAEVFRAILKSIGELGWQSAVGQLHDLFRNSDPTMGPVMPDIIAAIGQLRSLDSMDLLIDLLARMEVIGRKIPWENEGPIMREIEVALRGICGMDFKKAADWEQWWRAYREVLRANVDRTYWLRKTQARVLVKKAEKTPEDAVLVSSRLPPGRPNFPLPAATTTKKKGSK